MVGHQGARLVILMGEVVDGVGGMGGQGPVAQDHGHSCGAGAASVVTSVYGGDGVAMGGGAGGISSAQGWEVAKGLEVLARGVQFGGRRQLAAGG